ncbi:hypothetical protein JHK87_050032 [Glycine soja]|nr:hypothetical protein JHK87_050032 [Glycine soja]
MEQFLVMNVLGKKIKYRMLDNKLQLEWARVGSVRLVDMPNDPNIVHFTTMEDYQHALLQGPWIIADHYFVVQRRRPFFSLDTKVIQKIATLPIELYKDKFSWMVATHLGTMLKIDKLTSIHSCGRFGRIYIKIDL